MKKLLVLALTAATLFSAPAKAETTEAAAAKLAAGLTLYQGNCGKLPPRMLAMTEYLVEQAGGMGLVLTAMIGVDEIRKNVGTINWCGSIKKLVDEMS